MLLSNGLELQVGFLMLHAKAERIREIPGPSICLFVFGGGSGREFQRLKKKKIGGEFSYSETHILEKIQLFLRCN